jgi:hypothetical protein
MEGQITVTYTVICDNDIHIEVPLSELLANEKVQSLIKREFTKGARGVVMDSSKASGTVIIEKEKKEYQLTIQKDDFADALTLAEEDAKKRKILKNGCNMVELIDLTTVNPKG